MLAAGGASLVSRGGSAVVFERCRRKEEQGWTRKRACPRAPTRYLDGIEAGTGRLGARAVWFLRGEECMLWGFGLVCVRRSCGGSCCGLMFLRGLAPWR